MKIKELIQLLQEQEQEQEIRIALHKNGRPMGDTKEINPTDIQFVINQDSPKDSFFCISVNTAFEYPVKEEKLIIPELKSNNDYIIEVKIEESQK